VKKESAQIDTLLFHRSLALKAKLGSLIKELKYTPSVKKPLHTSTRAFLLETQTTSRNFQLKLQTHFRQ
jgi:hypothetical protein